MVTLHDVVIQIFEAKGFEVVAQEGYLLAHRDDVSVAIALPGSLVPEQLDAFLKTTAGFSGRRVLASLTPLDPGLEEVLHRHRIFYWDREALEHEVGSLHLSKLVPPEEPGLVEQVVADDYPRLPSEPHVAAPLPIIVESVKASKDQIIKPIIGVNEAREIARHTVNGVRFSLQLVPYYLFHYTLSLDRDGAQEERAGLVGVNGLTEACDVWAWGIELTGELEGAHARKEPRIELERAGELARARLVTLHSEEWAVERDYGHTLVTERKRAVPDEASVRLEPKGLVLLPVWAVEGTYGALLINAATGKILSEEYYRLEP